MVPCGPANPPLAPRDDIPSCVARRRFFARRERTVGLVMQEDMTVRGTRRIATSCDTGRGSLLSHKRKRSLATHEGMPPCAWSRYSSCGARNNAFLCREKAFLLASQEDVSSCVARRHYLRLCHKKACSCVARRHFSLCRGETFSSCVTRRYLFFRHEQILLLVTQEECLLVTQGEHLLATEADTSSYVARGHLLGRRKKIFWCHEKT